MELYDKKYVYFEWDDKLEGKEVILAHKIKDIKEFVNSGNKGRFFIAQKGNDLPFTNGLCECEFAYYDPNYEVKKAYNEGKKIQYKYRDTKWHDWILEKAPSDESFEDCEWRVKPDDCETNHDYFKNGEMKSYSKEAEEFARKRVDYEMSYTSNMDFTEAQIEWIKNHIYISVRNAYQSAVDKKDLQEMVSDTCHIMSDKESEEYEIPGFEMSKEPTKDRHLINKELAMWLAQGKGLAMDKGTGRKSTSYDYWEEDKMVDYMNIAVRKWNDTKWNYPTYGYCFGEE